MCLRLPDERIVATENFFCGSESENEIFIYGGQYCIQISSKEEFASMAKRAFTTGCMKWFNIVGWHLVITDIFFVEFCIFL